MLITRETDYAIRVVRALHRGGQLSAREIAERENMQQAITYKMLRKLYKAGVVESRRGVEGGYILTRPIDKLYLYDLFDALNEEMLLTECLEPGYNCANNQEGTCAVHRELSRIQKIIEAEMKRHPLSELLKAANEDGKQ
ncbi:MAG: RrF2 family transcriptional regulator [Oscillospiraceae bacterium]